MKLSHEIEEKLNPDNKKDQQILKNISGGNPSLLYNATREDENVTYEATEESQTTAFESNAIILRRVSNG